LGRQQASLLLLRRRWQTRVLCPPMTHLSRPCREPNPWPLACENLPLRRLTPVEVVWRSSDPPVHYRPKRWVCGRQAAEMSLKEARPHRGAKITRRRPNEASLANLHVIFKAVLGPYFS